MTPDAPVEVFGSEYLVTAVRGERIVGRAIRTLFGWHVIVPSERRRPQWIAVATQWQAAQKLYALAGAR